MNALLLALLAASIIWIQCWIGGTRLVFSLPPYGLLALGALLTLPIIRRRPPAPRLSCLLGTALLSAYVLARAAFSPIDYLWWTDFYMVMACLLAYLLVALHLTGPVERSWLFAAFLVLAMAEIFVGFHQFTQGDNYMAFGFIRPPFGRRASGFFISSISLAGYLEAVGVIALSMACWGPWRGWVRGLAGYAAALCYAGVAVTGSRGGYLSTVASLLAFGALSLWAVRRLAPQRFLATAIAGVAALAILLTAAPAVMSNSSMLRNRLEMLAEQLGHGTPDMRVYNWQAALDQFHLSPLLGTGAGSHQVFGRLFRRPELQADPIHAHSDYLELLAEYGVLGAVAMAIFLLPHLLSGFRSISRLMAAELADRYRPRSAALALQIGALSAVAAYLAHSAIDFNLHIPGNALLFAVIFGLLANPDPEAISTLSARAALIFRWALPALGLWMCASGLPKLRGEALAEKARVAVRNGSFQAGITLAQQARAAEPRNPEILFTLGDANHGLANALTVRTLRRPLLQAAADAYREGLKLFPQDENMCVRLGQVLDGLKEWHAADEAYRKAIELDPNLGILHAYYSAHLSACGHAEEAQEQLTTAQNLGKDNFAALLKDASASTRF